MASRARVTQLDVDFDARPIMVRGVVIAPKARMEPAAKLRADLARKLGQAVNVQVDQVLLDPGTSSLDAQRAELAKAQDTAKAEEQGRAIMRLVGLAAGIAPDEVTLDRDHQRAEAHGAPLPGADLLTYRAIEQRARSASDGWDIAIVPPLVGLPMIHFADNVDTLDPAAQRAVLASAWAAQRWNIASLGVPGFPASPSEKPKLGERRGLAIAAILKEQGIAAFPDRATGQDFRLSIASAVSPQP